VVCLSSDVTGLQESGTPVANVSVSYEPSDNTVSLVYTPPWALLTPSPTNNDSSPRDVTIPNPAPRGLTTGDYKVVTTGGYQTGTTGDGYNKMTSGDYKTVTTGGYKEFPVSEPDLSKLPERSALKGGKTRHQLRQKQSQQQSEIEQDTLASLLQQHSVTVPASSQHSPQTVMTQASDHSSPVFTTPGSHNSPLAVTTPPHAVSLLHSSHSVAVSVSHHSPQTVTSPPHPAAIQFLSSGVIPRVPPKVAPKPRTGP